jgi:hypothetical protein
MMRLGLLGTMLLAVSAFAEPEVGSFYEVSTHGSSTSLKAGETGKMVLSIKAKNGAHVSDEAPLRVELTSKQSKLGKDKLTLADAVNAKKPGDTEYADPRFEVPFTPTAQGPTSVEAKMTFFICTEKLCSRQTKQLSLNVDVM